MSRAVQTVLAIAGLGGLGAAPAPPMPSPRPLAAYPPDSFESHVLALHNGERARYGYPPLAWDGGLAAGASQWAAYMAQTGSFDHSPKANRPGIAENLAMGPRGYFDTDRLVGTWLAEKVAFIPGTFPRNSRTGNWLHVAHYSQMIWPTTTRIGCAQASARGNNFLVCRYSPKGNQDGRAVGITRFERG